MGDQGPRIKGLVFPVPVIVEDVDVAVGQEALGDDQVMRLVARKRLGREDEAGGQENINQAGRDEQDPGRPAGMEAAFFPEPRRQRPGDEDGQEPNRAQHGDPGQDGPQVPQENEELKEDEVEQYERRAAGDEPRDDLGGCPAGPPAQEARSVGKTQAEHDDERRNEQDERKNAPAGAGAKPDGRSRGLRLEEEERRGEYFTENLFHNDVKLGRVSCIRRKFKHTCGKISRGISPRPILLIPGFREGPSPDSGIT